MFASTLDNDHEANPGNGAEGTLHQRAVPVPVPGVRCCAAALLRRRFSDRGAPPPRSRACACALLLQAKRARKKYNLGGAGRPASSSDRHSQGGDPAAAPQDARRSGDDGGGGGGGGGGAGAALPSAQSVGPQSRFELRLDRESKDEIARRVALAQRPLRRGAEAAASVEDYHNRATGVFFARPAWSREMTKAELENREQRAFGDYTARLLASVNGKSSALSYFENNLETWRQLWHCLDMATVVLLVVDARFPPVHFSPALYRHVVEVLKLPLILIFNKCDLVSADTIASWKAYFAAHYPGTEVVTFANYYAVESKRRHRVRLKLPQGMQDLLAVWKRLGLPGAGAWEAKLAEEHEDGAGGAQPLVSDGEDEDDDDDGGGGGGDGGGGGGGNPAGRKGGGGGGGGPGARRGGAGARPALDKCPHDDDCRKHRKGGCPKVHSDQPELMAQLAAQPGGGKAAALRVIMEKCKFDGNCRNRKKGRCGLVHSDQPDLLAQLAAADAGGGGRGAVGAVGAGAGGHGPGSAGAGESGAPAAAATIALLGQPNVGKSTVLNSLMARHVVSTSGTPGRTKYFQTHFMTPEIMLCDCPGLIFPAVVPRSLQLLAGLYPLHQLREPYTAVEFLAERVDLVAMFKLSPAQDSLDLVGSEEAFKWSAYTICEAYAERRRYLTSRSGRLDTHRSAQELLKFQCDGRIAFALKPPAAAAPAADAGGGASAARQAIKPGQAPGHGRPGDAAAPTAPTAEEDGEDAEDADDAEGGEGGAALLAAAALAVEEMMAAMSTQNEF